MERSSMAGYCHIVIHLVALGTHGCVGGLVGLLRIIDFKILRELYLGGRHQFHVTITTHHQAKCGSIICLQFLGCKTP